ncbi:hypothetical protein Tco_0336066 [Tanacetum coccineum]
MNQLGQLQLGILKWEILVSVVHSRTAKNDKGKSNKTFQQDTVSYYQAWEQFKKLLLRCPQHYLTDMQEVILFYKGLDVPTRDILDFKGAIPSMKVTDAKKFIQDMVDHSQKWHNGTSTRCRRCAYAKDITTPRIVHIKKEKHLKKHITLNSVYHSNKEDNIEQQLQDSTKEIKRFLPLVDLGASVSVMPFSTYTNLGLGELAPTKLIAELANRTVKCPKGIAKNVLVGIDKFVFPLDFIVLDMPKDIKTPLILGRPFLSTTHAKIDVFKGLITLKVGNEKVLFKSDKPTSNIINSVYALSLRKKMELDLVARLM